MTDLRSLMPEELQKEFPRLPKYRTEQIFHWLQQKGARSAGEMTSLPKDLRAQISKNYLIASCEILRKQESAGGTRKHLFRLHDGNTVESVLMRYEHGGSVCISTQAGCKMNCAFCASGMHGFTRDLLAGEMLAQVQTVLADACAEHSEATCTPQAHSAFSIVLMGMGEPLDNYDNTLRFLRLVSHPEGMHIGGRKISLSTCGLVPQIDRLAAERLGLTLSISLHAPNDEIRGALMPVNRAYPIGELLAACKRYSEATGRRVSFEYALFAGVNDSPACAHELARLLKGLLCHVNLIPANAVQGTPFQPSKPEAIRAFQGILEKNGMNATVRRSLGREIDAACGQLRQLTIDNANHQ